MTPTSDQPGASGGGSGRVVVVGSANVDLTIRVRDLPGPGETVLGCSLARNVGGKGLNQAIAAARAGAPVSFVGAVGSDPGARLLRDALEADGIDSGALTSVDTDTGMAVIALSHSGENQILVVPGANLAVDDNAVRSAAELLASAAVVVTQLEIEPSALREIRCSSPYLVLNPAPYRPLAEADMRVDLCIPNATEIGSLLGRSAPTTPEDAVAAARQLHGPTAVVVTLGSLGAVVVDEGRDEFVQAPDVEAVDTTGAGDTLCGYLAAALAEGATLPEATRLGVSAASLSVMRDGASRSIPRRAELRAAEKT